MVSAPKSIKDFVREARKASKAARHIAALLADDEREISLLSARVAEDAKRASQRATSKARQCLLAQLAASVKLPDPKNNQSPSSVLFDLADQSERLALDIERAVTNTDEHAQGPAIVSNTVFVCEFARARKSGVASLLENDALIESLRATLATLRS